MRDIGRADRVLVVLSQKYVKSVNCMLELLYLYQRSLGDRADFLSRVVVLTVGDSPKFYRASDRAAHVLYWQEEDKKLDVALSQLDRISISDADRAEQLAIKDFSHRVSDILSWVSDTLMPRVSASSNESLDAWLCSSSGPPKRVPAKVKVRSSRSSGTATMIPQLIQQSAGDYS